MNKPLIIGITGGIGSGKSTLSRKLREIGYLVYDSDSEARRLQNEHPLIKQQLTAIFGTDIYNSQGLNRVELARIVFAESSLLEKLNAVVHPVVKDDFNAWLTKNNEQQLLFIESAILFESGFDRLVDKVILMTASEEIRIARVVKRDGIAHEQVKARMKHQRHDVKTSKVEFVIHSDDQQPLDDKMHKILDELLSC